MPIWGIESAEESLLFFPEALLLYRGERYEGVSYDSVKVSLSFVRFSEKEGVPEDAQEVRRERQRDAICGMRPASGYRYRSLGNCGLEIVPGRGAEIHILQIRTPVPDFDAWRAAFDSDPVGRKRSGVRRTRVLRATDNPDYVMIELEFDSASEAVEHRVC